MKLVMTSYRYQYQISNYAVRIIKVDWLVSSSLLGGNRHNHVSRPDIWALNQLNFGLRYIIPRPNIYLVPIHC